MSDAPQSDRRTPGTILGLGRLALLAAFGLAVAATPGCRPSGPEVGEATPGAPSGGLGASTNPGAELGAEPAPETSPLRDGEVYRGVLQGLDSAHSARNIRALTRAADGTPALILAQPRRRETTLATYRLAPAPGHLAPTSTRMLSHAPTLAAEPVVVAVPERGFVVLKATDNVGVEGRGASLYVLAANSDLALDGELRAADLGGWLLAGRPVAARLGDGVGVCFSGTRPDTDATAVAGIVCGQLAVGGSWITPPRAITADAEGSFGVSSPAVGGGEGRFALVTYYVGGEQDRVVGRLLEVGVDGLVSSAAVDLTGQALDGTTPFAYRSPPRFAARDGGVAFALPGFGVAPARAGFVDRSAEVRGGLRQVPELASAFEVAVALPDAEPPAILYDSYGLRGERSAVVFGPEAPLVVELAAPLGSEGPQARLRNGAAGAGLYVGAWEDEDGRTVVTVLAQRAVVGARGEGQR